MKKILAIFAVAVAAVSCYDNYVGDYEVVACGFANQTDVRSLIIGEGMNFSTGVALGGVIENNEDRQISFEVDYSLVNSSTLSAMKSHSFSYISSLMTGVSAIQALPADIYELNTDSGRPGTTVIRKGTHLGVIDVKVDSAAFLSQADRLLPYCVIPIRLTDGHGTEIMSGRESTVIGVRYENMLFGNWYHGGVTTVKDSEGNVTDRISYSTTIPQAENKVWTLTTTGPFTLTTNGIASELTGTRSQLSLTLKDDDTIDISSLSGATYDVQPDGESRFLRTKLLQDRKIVLNYKYEKGGSTYHVSDTLTFRNRVRDGVNEWQDENSENYN